jgi:hypothetical protein
VKLTVVVNGKVIRVTKMTKVPDAPKPPSPEKPANKLLTNFDRTSYSVVSPHVVLFAEE